MDQILPLDGGNITPLESKIEILLKENNGLPTEARKLYDSTLTSWRETISENPTDEPFIAKVGTLFAFS